MCRMVVKPFNYGNVICKRVCKREYVWNGFVDQSALHSLYADFADGWLKKGEKNWKKNHKKLVFHLNSNPLV